MLSITPLLDKGSALPVYMQLYNYIKDQIQSRSLTEGSTLPSIRGLAQHLSLSKNTIEAAYQQLMMEGYIESKERSGYVVMPITALLPFPYADEAEPVTEPSHPVPEKHSPAPMIDFRYGDIDAERFPVDLWRRCLSDSLADPAGGLLGYAHPQGLRRLRDELAAYVYESRGVRCTADQIIVCAGTQQAVSMLCQLLQLRKKTVAMENPGYNGVRTIFRNHGCGIAPIPLQQDGIDIEKLYDSGAFAAYVTPSHQFPLGMVLPIQKRLALLQWANDQDGIIIEDDYDSEFKYDGYPIPSLKALDAGDRVIYMGTLSKSFLPAARLSYLVLPKKWIELVQPELQLYSQPVSPIIQQAIVLFISRGHFARHVRRMRRLYQSKRKALVASIKEHMGDKAEIFGDKSGLHLIVSIAGHRDADLAKLAEAHGCRVYSPAAHWDDPAQCPSSYVMLGFGGLDEAAIRDGIVKLSRAWLAR